jgi:hypothetical protein
MSTLPDTQLEELEHMSNTRMSSNYDLNIWDKVGYETEYKEEGWAIEVYTYPYLGAFYGSGNHVQTIDLTLAETKRLTLGWGPDLGGDYTPDSDFWIDKETFFDTYTDIPERVANLLWALPEYEQSLDIDNRLAV